MTLRGIWALGLAFTLGTGSAALAFVDDKPGPIDSIEDIQDTGKILFKTADANNDGTISQKEAIDAANLVAGGFFFRADANGDGTLSKEEAQQARDAFLAQKPWLRFVLQRAKAAENQQNAAQPGQANPGSADIKQAVDRLLDTNNDNQLQATEVRQAVQTGVQALFAAADTNRDGQMTPTEINAAMYGAVRAASQAAFQSADDDRNNQISRAEFQKAIVEPAGTLFVILDANNDGQLSAQELQNAERVVMSQLRSLRVPEPANSPKHLMEQGRLPGQAAPAPAFGAPAQPGQAAPAPAPTPAPANPGR